MQDVITFYTPETGLQSRILEYGGATIGAQKVKRIR
jgi:hypothetical protein